MLTKPSTDRFRGLVALFGNPPRARSLVRPLTGAALLMTAGTPLAAIAFNPASLTPATPVSAVTVPRYEQYTVVNSRPEARAKIVLLAYVRPGRNRPVIFAFNGGPGDSSLWLNYGVLGPTRISLPRSGERNPRQFTPVANQATPLDVADVVMIDPVDTGLSRVIQGDPDAFFRTATDGAAVADAIRQWLERHQRLASPVYILGESFGCQRAATVSHDLISRSPYIHIHGIILISQELNSPEVDERPRNIISYVVGLADIARAARYHHLLDDEARPVRGTDAEINAFASTSYLEALFKGRELPASEASRIAARLNSFTGIPSAWFLQNGLAITREQFARIALKEKGERMGTYDDRFVGPENAADPFEGTIDKPFLRAALEDLRSVSPGEPMSDYRANSDVAARDFRFSFNGALTGERPFIAYLQGVLAKRPRAKLLIVGGLYDLHTTKEITQYMLSQYDFGSGRVITAFYPSGHMVYLSPQGRVGFSRELHRFIAETSRVGSNCRRCRGAALRQ